MESARPSCTFKLYVGGQSSRKLLRLYTYSAEKPRRQKDLQKLAYVFSSFQGATNVIKLKMLPDLVELGVNHVQFRLTEGQVLLP